MSARPLFAIGFLAMTTGCVVYDGKCKDDFGWDDTGWDDADPGDEDGDEDEVSAPSFSLTPAEGIPGASLIASLQVNEPMDFEAVSEVIFYGDVVLCTSQPRSRELLLTVSVADDAEPGLIDIMVEMDDGSHYLVEDAFDILNADGSSIEDDDDVDTGAGGDGGGDDGGGDDGGSDDGGSGGDGGNDYNPCG
jgi:hypothetical protein